MSAGPVSELFSLAEPTSNTEYLAPLFRQAVEQAIAACNAQSPPLDAKIVETFRSDELQKVYFARGRTVKPPATPVTNAQTNLKSWHGYGLAVDVIHRTKEWDVPASWFAAVAAVFTQYNCKWGGDWKSPDMPHFQWAACKPTPSAVAVELIQAQGVEAVWKAVGAG